MRFFFYSFRWHMKWRYIFSDTLYCPSSITYFLYCPPTIDIDWLSKRAVFFVMSCAYPVPLTDNRLNAFSHGTKDKDNFAFWSRFVSTHAFRYTYMHRLKILSCSQTLLLLLLLAYLGRLWQSIIFRPDLELEFKCYHHDDKMQYTNWPQSVQVRITAILDFCLMRLAVVRQQEI